jgi:flagellar biosynthesis protein FlhB
MADQGHKSEKPTARRLEKARKEGQFLQAREFIAAAQLLVVLSVIGFSGAHWVRSLQIGFRRCIQVAFRSSLNAAELVAIARDTMAYAFAPLIAGAALVLMTSLGLQFTLTKMGVSLALLAPNPNRFNPINRIRQMPRENLFSAVYATFLFAITGTVTYFFAAQKLSEMLAFTRAPVPAAASALLGLVTALAWRLTAVFCVIGAIDLLRKYREHSETLRMTRQEVRDEMKDTEGRPEIKQRIRAIRRTLLRRQMMKAVPTATAVIVNPTHYAVAIRYQLDLPGAPVVVAKGKNFLAQRIRMRALEHGVPLVENPSLARGLYKSVQVGQEIPAQLYRAVAEVLAYVFNAMDGKLPR